MWIFVDQIPGSFSVLGHAGVRGNEIPDDLAIDGSAVKSVGPEPALGVSRKDIRRVRRWLVNQHWVWWRGLGDTQRQARELISGTCPSAKAKLLFFNPYPTAFPYGNGMVLHFYQQQESSTTKTVHKVINKGLKTYV